MSEEDTKTIEMLRRKVRREKAAREQAESLLESKSLELYTANQSLLENTRKEINNVARLNAIMNSMKDSAIVTDCDLNILDINHSAELFLSAERRDVYQKKLLDVFVPEQIDVYQELCDKDHEVKIVDREFVVDVQGRSKVTTEVSITSFQHDEEQFLLHFIRDISKRKSLEAERNKMQDELTQAAKWEAVGQLAGGIAHEINTPSQYIGDNLTFLQTSTQELFAVLQKALELRLVLKVPEKQTEVMDALNQVIEECDLEYLLEEMPLALQQSRDGIAQVSKIVLAMKNFSHPGRKEKEPVDINKAIETTLTISRNEWKHVADVKTNFDPELTHVNCTPGGINQVFLNVIVNAAHAIGAKGEDAMGVISVSTRKSDEYAEIIISDTGSGIAEEHRENIFNPFFTTKSVGHGTGQGLSIAHDIVVDKHEGRLFFETQMGKGTDFHILLPL